MKEILTITNRLHESMKSQVEIFMAGVEYANKQKLKELKCVEEIYEVLVLLHIDLQNNYINYSNCEAYEGDTLTEMKKCMDIFIKDLSKTLKKDGVPTKLQVQIVMTLAEMKTQWK